MKDKPTILVTNDDGFDAQGVDNLIKWIVPFGNVVMVCPDGPRSAQSMAMTMNHPLFITELESKYGVKRFKVNGTPVDCVKIGVDVILGKKRPDLVVSGINHGSNAAVNVIYSGTMGAAMEGCAFGIPSIGFSLTSHLSDVDFSPCQPFVEKITEAVLANGLPSGVCLNVNIPDEYLRTGIVPVEARLARGCKGRWTDEFKEYTDPFGRKFYWITGDFVNSEPESHDTDEWCLAHNIVSVVPTMLDRTAPASLTPEWLKKDFS